MDEKNVKTNLTSKSDSLTTTRSTEIFPSALVGTNDGNMLSINDLHSFERVSLYKGNMNEAAQLARYLIWNCSSSHETRLQIFTSAVRATSTNNVLVASHMLNQHGCLHEHFYIGIAKVCVNSPE